MVRQDAPYNFTQGTTSASLQKFARDFTAGQQVHRAAGGIDDRVVQAEAQGVVDDRAKIFDADFARRRMLGLAVCAADHLAVFVAAAADENALSLRPVIAASVAVDGRRSAELASRDDQRVVEHTSFCEILNQHSDGSVVARHFRIEGAFDISVVVPVAGVQRDKPNSGFHQPPREQCLFAPVVTVALASFLVFFVELKRVASPTGQDDVECLLIDCVEMLKRAVAVESLSQIVELFL